MPYVKINPTGCGIHKNRAKLRLDFFLNPDDPNYDKHYVQVPVFPQGGYPGEVKDSLPVDKEDYSNWLNNLPRVWQNNPFHSHFIYPDKDASDAKIKEEIEICLNYFYAFHQHCWDNKKTFKDEWAKVPSLVGDVRCPFMKGKAAELKQHEDKVTDILRRPSDFTINVSKVSLPDLKIGEKGTVDVGSAAINRTYEVWLVQSLPGWFYYTYVEGANPANADGTIDTIEAWFNVANPGNIVKYGTFSNPSGETLTCHDAEQYGSVSAGSKQTCSGLSIAILLGEYIGADGRYDAQLSVDMEAPAGDHIWYHTGQYCDPADSAVFSRINSYQLSLYGTGPEASAGWTGKISGVTNPAKVMGVDVANIAKIKGVA